MVRAGSGRAGIAAALAAGVVLALGVVALAQSEGEPTESQSEGNMEALPEVSCESGTMVGATTLDYSLPEKGATRSQDAALTDYLETHGFALTSRDFVFAESTPEATGGWAVPVEGSVEAPQAVAVLTELIPNYWAVLGFTACAKFEDQYVPEETK
jgi:hypothetical protein